MYNKLTLNPIERLAITHPFAFLNNVFSQEECKKIISLCKNYKLEKANIGFDKSVNKKIRKSNIVFIENNEDTGWIFERTLGIVSTANDMFYNFCLNGFSNIQFTEYSYKEKGFYDWHVDCAFGEQDGLMQAMRKLSLSILLNEEFEGGDMQFSVGDQRAPMTAEKATGKALAFPSFIPHRVTPVTKGYRYSLVVWVYGPKFI